MSIWKSLFNGTVGKVVDLAKDPLKQWQERKTIVAEAKMEVTKIEAQAKVAVAQRKLDITVQDKSTEASWDRKAMDDADKTWKDEVQFAVVILPIAACFFWPDKVTAGFEAIKGIPWWWNLAFLGILARNFSLRWLVAPIASRFGGKT